MIEEINNINLLIENLKENSSDDEEICELLDKIKDSINIRNISNNVSDTYRNLLIAYKKQLDGFKNNYFTSINNGNKHKDLIVSNLKMLVADAKRVNFLSNLAVTKKTVVIVGANGSGKSTFVNSLYHTSLQNLMVIPAQKTLFFSSSANKRTEIEKNKYVSEFLRRTNTTYKEDDKELPYNHQIQILYPFTYMITTITNDYINEATNERQYHRDAKKTIFDNLKEVWHKMIPEITFEIDSIQRTINPIKDGEKYSINQLSDGEKSILFYIGNVLLAKKNGYIIVDEPETFINPSIFNKLWDMLINIRSDCQFIFTSHNVQFINARHNSSIYWCKEVKLPDKIDLRKLSNNDGLPVELLTELVGSRRKILFCEGDENSYDYKIFSSIFLDKYTIKPVGGHDKVIEYTRVFNELPKWVDNDAVGIIDRDGLDEDKISSFSKEKVISLPYNEIEMMLLDEEVIRAVLNCFPDDQNNDLKINNFKKAFCQQMKDEKDKIIYNIIKNNVDYDIRMHFIDSSKSRNIDELQEDVKKLPESLNVSNTISKVTKKFDKSIKEHNYNDLLKLNTLKKETLKGLCNRYIYPRYDELALGMIEKENSLKKFLRDKININRID